MFEKFESPLVEGRFYRVMIEQGMTPEEVAEHIFQISVARVKWRLALVRQYEERATAVGATNQL
jgi:hypothetical protein